MKRFGYILILFVSITVFAASCMSARSTAGKGCKVNAGMVGYR